MTDAPVSDERLAELLQNEDAYAGLWAPGSPSTRQWHRDLASALRELQRLRAGRVPAEPIEIEREPGDD